MYQPTDQHIGDWMKPGNFFGTPVDYEAKDMNPWRKSILQILVGIALYTVSVTYLLLEILLPLAGVILMYLGLRTLREENRWFLMGNLLVCVEGLWVLTDIFFTGTALNTAFHESAVYTVGWWITRLTQLGVLLCLRQGMAAVFDKTGRLPRVKWVTVLMALSAAATVLQSPGIPAGYLLIGVYAGILWALYRLAKTLDGIGYEILSSPAALSDTVLTVLLVGLAVAATLAGSLFLRKYPMNWTEHTQTDQQIRQELTEDASVDLVLQDLTDADLLSCQGGTVAFWDTDTHTIGYNDSYTMYVTHVYIRLPGTDNRWKVIHHFRWPLQIASIPHVGTESLLVRLGNMAQHADHFTGHILCDQRGITLGADPADISLVPYSYFVNFDMKAPTVGLFTNFSLPKTARNVRGYVSYELKLDESPDFSGFAPPEVRYIYQAEGTFLYPSITAQEFEMTGSYYDGSYGSFSCTVQKEG